MSKKLLRRVGDKWYTPSEIRQLKKRHKLKSLKKRASKKTTLPDINYFTKISKESGYIGIRHHYFGKRKRR